MTEKNGPIRIGPGWAAVVLMLLLPILAGLVHSYVRFDRIEQKLNQIQAQHHEIVVLMRKHWNEPPSNGDQQAKEDSK